VGKKGVVVIISDQIVRGRNTQYGKQFNCHISGDDKGHQNNVLWVRNQYPEMFTLDSIRRNTNTFRLAGRVNCVLLWSLVACKLLLLFWTLELCEIEKC
jgi:hypothetical protein